MFNAPVQPALEEPGRHTFRLLLAYDGTDFFGWQVQPGRPTVQGVLAETVRLVTGESVLPQGSGRTDTGVHAEGQTVSLNLRANVPADRLLRALNRKLPSSVRVTAAELAAPAFHARAGVAHKTYEYRIFRRREPGGQTEAICPPAMARFAWDCRWPLRIGAMQQAAALLTGTHDFTSLAATDPDRTERTEGKAGRGNVRTIYESAWSEQGGLLTYRVTGDGFLHHMVRNIVGTCVLAGRDNLAPARLPAILAARDRREAGPTAPPQGLHLMQVVYTNDVVKLPTSQAEAWTA